MQNFAVKCDNYNALVQNISVDSLFLNINAVKENRRMPFKPIMYYDCRIILRKFGITACKIVAVADKNESKILICNIFEVRCKVICN